MKRFIRIGVVTAWPEDDWHSERLLAACARRGGGGGHRSRRARGRGSRTGSWCSPGARRPRPSTRSCSRGASAAAGDADVQFEIYRALEATGAMVVNRLDPLLAAQDKFRTSWLLAARGRADARARRWRRRPTTPTSARRAREAVVKPLAGSLGDGVERVRADDDGRARGPRAGRAGRGGLPPGVRSASGPRPPGVRRRGAGPRRDRAARASGRVADERRPGGAGGGGRRSGRSVAAVAEAAAGALGLDYAGVDLVRRPEGPTVLEVNGNPSWQGILEATGLDMAEVIAEHVLGRALRRRRTSDHIVLERSTGAIHG